MHLTIDEVQSMAYSHRPYFHSYCLYREACGQALQSELYAACSQICNQHLIALQGQLWTR